MSVIANSNRFLFLVSDRISVNAYESSDDFTKNLETFISISEIREITNKRESVSCGQKQLKITKINDSTFF